MQYLYVSLTILLTAYGQLILKWRLAAFGPLPPHVPDQISHVLRALLDPFIISGLVAAFLAALTWMAALSELELSHAYPFMSLSFVLVVLLSAWLLGEPLTVAKIVGVGLIALGTFVIGRAQ